MDTLYPHNNGFISLCLWGETCTNSWWKDLGISRNQHKRYVNRISLKGHTVTAPIDFFNLGMCSPIYNGDQIPVIGSKKNWMAINKPVGIHSVSNLYSEQNNAENFIRQMVNFPFRIGLNRLDQFTSGVLVYYLDKKLVNPVQLRREVQFVEKIYYLVINHYIGEKGEMNDLLIPCGKNAVQMKCYRQSGRENKKEVQLAKLQYQFIAEIDLGHLYRVNLLTGVRHQIRVQFSSRNVPILGDKLYSGKDADRLYLHAYQYQFNHLNINYSFQTAAESWFMDLL